MMKLMLVGSDGRTRYLNLPISIEREKKVLKAIDDNAGRIDAFNLLTDLLDLLPKAK